MHWRRVIIEGCKEYEGGRQGMRGRGVTDGCKECEGYELGATGIQGNLSGIRDELLFTWLNWSSMN